MQFFKHYTNMRHDVKIRRVIKRFGLKGYGLYNLIIESIAESLNSDKPLPELEETARDIAEENNDDTALINDMMVFMINQGLFELNEITGRILCQKLYKFLDKSQTRSEEIRKMIEIYKTSVCLRQIETVRDNHERVEVEVEVEVDKNRIDIEKNVYDGKFFSVSENQHKIYMEAYPTLDLQTEYREMTAWLESNPQKRKTEKGYPKFINGWLLRDKEKKKNNNSEDEWWMKHATKIKN